MIKSISKVALTTVIMTLGCDEKPSSKSSNNSLTAEVTMTSPFRAPPQENEGLESEFHHSLFSMQILGVKLCSLDGPFAASKGKQLISVRIKLKNKNSTALHINGLAMMMEKGDQRFRPTLAGCEPALESGYLGAQKERSGALTFELPEELTPPWQLHFKPFIVGSPEIDAQIQISKLEN